MARDRLREPEARILALRIAADQPGREASMAYIKAQVPSLVTLTPLDLRPSPTRPAEERWQQITGNVVSHQKSKSSLFSKGYAERTADGIRVTDAGVAYLKKLGF